MNKYKYDVFIHSVRVDVNLKIAFRDKIDFLKSF